MLHWKYSLPFQMEPLRWPQEQASETAIALPNVSSESQTDTFKNGGKFGDAALWHCSG
ncbi:hypothetical protein CA13_02300 [Planctomycetes bacterium CA13]|uniref:Uncharacterized protein n=1 Tax=Novipirellula herctigrandis TaxID=2527986 RepID=A0A5C5YW77_9BACT|nr:hypothetical protein CA13_02300 [Planctomycetes bacterium CA13]